MELINRLVLNHDIALENIQKFIDDQQIPDEQPSWKIENPNSISLGRILIIRIDGTNIVTPNDIKHLEQLDFKWEGTGIDEKHRLYVVLSYDYNTKQTGK